MHYWISKSILLFIFAVCVCNTHAQGLPECPITLGYPCVPPNTYFGGEHWDYDNFCKDDTSMLWATWGGLTVPGYFAWTLVDSFGNNPQWIGSTTDDTIFVLGLGMYCLTIYDTSGCWVFSGGIWPGDLPLSPIAEPLITPTHCGQNIGAIHLNVSPGEYPTDWLTYEWENGSTQPFLDHLPAGDYSVTITRHNVQQWGCPHEYTFHVPNYDTIALDMIIIQDSSCADGNGVLDLMVMPNQLTYNYNWSNGSTSHILYDLDPGMYSVTVTGPSPCVATGTYEILDHSSPISSLSATVTPTYCNLWEGGADLTVSGGLGPFEYAWSNGEDVEDPVGLPPGISTVTVTGFGDCKAMLEVFVPNVDSLFSVTAEVVHNTSCNPPDGFIDLTADPDGDYEYEWLEGQFTEDLYDLASGIYQVTITAGSCEEHQVYTIEDHVLIPHLSASVVPAICGFPNGSINLSVSGGDSPYTYQWSNGMTTQDVSNLLAGNYMVTVTGHNNCTAVDTIYVNSAAATFSVNSIILSNTACQSANGSIQLSIVQPGSYTYNWSTGDTINQLMNLEAGTYTVTITQNANCTITENYVVADSLPATDTTKLYSTTCNSLNAGIFTMTLLDLLGCDSVIITTIGYQPLDSTFIQSYTCNINNAGTTTQHLLTSQHCDSMVITTRLYIPPDTITITGATCDPSLAGINIQQLSNQYGCDSTVISNYSLLPSDTINLHATTCDSSMAGIKVQNLTNQFGCDSIVTTTIDLLPHHHTVLNSSTCDPAGAGIFDTHFINQYGCDSLVTLNVALDLLDTTEVLHQTCDPSLTGIKLSTLTSVEGCDSILREIITLFPQPSLALMITSDFHGAAISCAGGIDGSITAIATGEIPLNYVWSTGQTVTTITGLGAGSYALTITDGNGCTAASSILLGEPEPFNISFTVSPLKCFGDADGIVEINSFGGTAPYLYSLNGSSWQASPLFDKLSNGSFMLTVIDANDCQVSEIIIINAPGELVVDLGEDQLIHLGDTAIIHALVNIPFDSLAAIQWNGMIDPNCANCLTQSIIPILTSTYSVTVSDAFGCKATDDMTVYVDRSIDIYVPNVFSPNGDNVNDLFYIYSSRNTQQVDVMEIYDRWGELVFRDEHFMVNDPAHGWTGTMRGQELNPGVFVYRIVLTDPDGKVREKVGNVTLVR